MAGLEKKEARITFNYDGRTRQPSLSDLMPLTDNSNPLYITRGNPDLKQMFAHSMRISFQHSKKAYLRILEDSWNRIALHR